MEVLSLLVKYQEGLFSGLMVTLALVGITWIGGIGIGTWMGWLAAGKAPLVSTLSQVGAFILSSIPILVVLFWFHYPAQSLLNVVIDPFWTAAFALTLANVFVVSEIVRSSLDNFPRQYESIGRVCGLSEQTIFRRIKLPLILRHIASPLLISQVTALQATLFASLISVEELFRVVQRINAVEYKPVELYTALALLFLVVCAPLNLLAYVYRRRANAYGAQY